MEFRTLLLATDFSAPALAAAQTARKLAQLFGSEIHVVHVVEQLGGTGNLRFPPDVPPALLRPLIKAAEEQLQTWVKDQLGEIPSSRLHLRMGHPYEEILRAEKDSGAMLVVQGTHGRSGWDRLTLGSVAERVIASCGAPVMTVRSVPKLEKDAHVLVATDMSASAKEAAKVGCALATKVDAQVSALAVLEPPAMFKASSSEQSEAQQKVQTALDAFVKDSLGGVKLVKAAVRIGSPAKEIVATCTEWNADVVVMGSAGQGGVAEWMLGGVTQRVLRGTTIAMLTARASP